MEGFRFSGTHINIRFFLSVHELNEMVALSMDSMTSVASCYGSPEPPKEKLISVEVEEKADSVESDIDVMEHLHDLWLSIADRENDPLPHHVRVSFSL